MRKADDFCCDWRLKGLGKDIKDTCDKLKMSIMHGDSSRFKMYQKYGKNLSSDALGKKWYVSGAILGIISGSLPGDQGAFTCMIKCN